MHEGIRWGGDAYQTAGSLGDPRHLRGLGRCPGRWRRQVHL